MQTMSMRAKERFKGLAIGLLTPIRFASTTGHFKSSIARRAVDVHGDPLPWFSYPAIFFLQQLDLGNDDVLEFGGGQSTLWWADYAKSVFTVEHDPEWFSYLRKEVQRSNVTLNLAEDLDAHARLPLGRQFSVVLIDGGDRLKCAGTALDVVHGDDPLVILDNSEGHWTADGSASYPILDLFDAAGWLRVDISGYAPGTIRPTCTSFFFRPGTKRLTGLRPPPRLPR